MSVAHDPVRELRERFCPANVGNDVAVADKSPDARDQDDAVRADESATAIARSAVDTLDRLDPNLAVARLRTFEGAIAESLARERLNALVSGAFALSGLVLACFGLYGLLAFLVAERTKESSHAATATIAQTQDIAGATRTGREMSFSE